MVSGIPIFKSRGAYLALLTVAFCLFVLPGFFNLPVLDRDEPRFAQASKQMLETGDYIDIRFQDEVRYLLAAPSLLPTSPRKRKILVIYPS